MLHRDDWLDLARKLDWELSYVREEEAFPPELSGRPWLPHADWADWDEPYRTGYGEYVRLQHEKEQSVAAVREVVGRLTDLQSLDRGWLAGLKLHAATLPLAEFAAVVGNLRAARFGRDGAWRTMALLGALDECRHTQIPLRLMHDLVRWDRQFDWTHRLYHSGCWVGVAGRHLADDLLRCSDPIEFAVATHFVFETGFTNLQFVALAALADRAGDRLFEKMLTSIQTDEARHAQIGPPVLAKVAARDPLYAQQLVDKWFWRSWLLFAVVTGFTMDYLTPLRARPASFREFVEEWILEQFVESLEQHGLARPWYWDTFVAEMGWYHHLVYASAYTYRATVWFDMVVPGPEERAWLRRKYPETWDQIDPVWERITDRWRGTPPGIDFAVHATAIPGFCNLCQLVLCNGTPTENAACTLTHGGQRYIFCSEPCRRIFEAEPARYAAHKDMVRRVLTGEAPGNLVALLTQYCGLDHGVWGKDAFAGAYPWLTRSGQAR